MNIHQTRAKRREVIAEANAIMDAPGASDGTLTADQLTDVNAKHVEARRLEGVIEALETRDAIDTESRGRPLNDRQTDDGIDYRVFAQATSRTATEGVDGWLTANGERVPVLTREQRIADFLPTERTAADDIGMGGFIRALINGPKNELERRALAEGNISTGGALAPATLAAGIIDHARIQNVAFQAGALTVPMPTRQLVIAKNVSDPVPQWRGENTLIAESEPVFDQAFLTAKSLAVRFVVSRELLEDAPNMDAELRYTMAQGFARGLDDAIFFGSGASATPLGIANTPGVQVVSMGTNGGQLTGYAPFLDAAYQLQAANEGRITATVLAPRSSRVVAGLVDTTGQPLQPPPLLKDVPVYTTNAIPVNQTQGTATNASSAFIGDFSEVLVGIRTELQITVLNERFAEMEQVGFVGWMRADVTVARPAALAKIVGIKP